MSLFLAIPIRYLTLILSPIVWLLEKATQPLTKGQVLPTTNETEIRFLTRIGRTEGVIEADEAEMIHRVFHLNDLSASDLMTPRILLTYLKGDLTLGECQDFIINSEHTRILIIQENIDNVIGTALKQELLTAIIEGKKRSNHCSVGTSCQFCPRNHQS